MRLQLALNVHDLDTAVDFYSKMFDTPPAKTRPGYANYEIADPPLKLVLFEDADAPRDERFHHLNHLGVETTDADEVVSAEQRCTASGIATTGVDDTECCFAAKTETWVSSPDGARWEWYVKTGDSETRENIAVDSATGTSSCC